MFTNDFVADMLKTELPPPVKKEINIDELSKNMALKMENLLEQKLKEFEENLVAKVSTQKPTETVPNVTEPIKDELIKESEE